MRLRLYVDESGDHTYRNLEDAGRRYLGLISVAIESDYYRNESQPGQGTKITVQGSAGNGRVR